jgi:hypothetical protein
MLQVPMNKLHIIWYPSFGKRIWYPYHFSKKILLSNEIQQTVSVYGGILEHSYRISYFFDLARIAQLLVKT